MALNKSKDKQALIKKLADVRVIEIACKQIGISRATFYRWQHEDEDFASECEIAIAQGTDRISDMAESQVISKIKGGDYKASTYWLEHHHKDYMPSKIAKQEKSNPYANFTTEQLTMLLEATDIKLERIYAKKSVEQSSIGA